MARSRLYWRAVPGRPTRLIRPASTATARSAIEESHVSPDRCDTTVRYPEDCASFTASSVSLTVPTWFSFTRSALATPSAIPRARISEFVTKTSSPTSSILRPRAHVISIQPARSPSASPSSMDAIG